MKNKKSYRKYTVAGLSFLIVASVLGSAAGTVAWYQYSTRTSAYINGADGSCTKNLQMIIGEVELDEQGKEAKSYGWGSDFTFADIKEYIRDTLKDDKIADNYGTIAPVSNYRAELGENDPDSSSSWKEGDKYINTKTSVLFTKEGDSWKKAKLMTKIDDTKNSIQVDMGGMDKVEDGAASDTDEIGDLYLNSDGRAIFTVSENSGEITAKVWKKTGYLFDFAGDGTPDASLGASGNTYYDKTNKKAYQKTAKASNEDADATDTYEWTELSIDYTYTPYVVGGIENLSNLNSDSPLGKFYSTLRYQDADFKDYDSPVASDYIQFPVTLKLKDVKTDKNSEKRTDVYLEDLQINTWDSSSKKENDLKDNFRVHYSAVSQEVVTDEETSKVSLVNDEEKDTLLNVMEKTGEENELTNYTYGPLDLNGDGQFDTSKYTYSKSDTLIYGVKGTKQTSTYYSDIKPTVSNGKYNNTGKAIGIIPDNGYLKVMVTVWLDGWSKNTVNPEKTVAVVTKKNTLAEKETALDLAVEEWVGAADDEEKLKTDSPSDADKIAKATEKTAEKRKAATTALTNYITAFLAYSAALKNTIDSTLPEKNAWTNQFDTLVDSTDKEVTLDKFKDTETNKPKTISTIVSSFTGYAELTKAYETLVNNSIASWDGTLEKSLYEVGMTFGVSADF